MPTEPSRTSSLLTSPCRDRDRETGCHSRSFCPTGTPSTSPITAVSPAGTHRSPERSRSPKYRRRTCESSSTPRRQHRAIGPSRNDRLTNRSPSPCFSAKDPIRIRRQGARRPCEAPPGSTARFGGTTSARASLRAKRRRPESSGSARRPTSSIS